MQEHWHLHEHGFFTGLDKEIVQSFQEVAIKRKVKKNEFLFFEEDAGDSCFYLDTGAIKIFRFTLLGKEPIFFIRKSGEMFGLAEVIASRPRKCNAQALCDSEVWSVSKSNFEQICQKHYPLARKVMEVLGRRLRYLGEQVENLMVCDVSTRLMKLLLHLCLFNADSQPLCRVPVKLPITLSQSQMASMTGSCQQTISETLKNLQDEGLISMDRKEITILDPLDFMNRLY